MLNQNWMLVHNISLAVGCISVMSVGLMLFLGTWLVWPVASLSCGCFVAYEVSGNKV